MRRLRRRGEFTGLPGRAMRALVLRDFYDIAVEERPDPVADPGQVVGHETVGRVRELGPDVEGVAIGQLVTVNPVMSCHECPACLSGQEHWCSRRVVLGVAPEVPAAFADRVAAPASNIVPLPEHMPEELGALAEPMAVGYHAVRRGQPKPDDRVLVIGGGPIGQACLLAARRLGVHAMALSDVSPSRRDLCARLGAEVVDPTAGNLPEAVADRLGGPASLVVDAVGLSPTVSDAMAASGLGSRIVLVGMGSPRLELSAYALSTEERALIGSFTYSAAEFADTAEWVGTVPDGIDALIDGRVGWEGAPQSFDDLARGRSTASKILVFPQGPPASGAV